MAAALSEAHERGVAFPAGAASDRVVCPRRLPIKPLVGLARTISFRAVNERHAMTVDALLPLAFLEAVRTVDAPDDDRDAEYVPELRNKKLGLSDTVYAQVQRYAESVRRGHRIPYDEAAALARLVGRRPDAEVVFRSAGRYLAGEAFHRIAAPTRAILRLLPSVMSRPLALRHIRRISQRFLWSIATSRKHKRPLGPQKGKSTSPPGHFAERFASKKCHHPDAHASRHPLQ